MLVLYDRSVEHDALVLGTSNKTELLLGYGTIHGDLASALNPLGDQLAPSSVTPGTAGVYYRKLGVFDFFDITTGDRVYNGSVYPASSSSFLAAAVDFPDGSTVSEMSIWAVNTSSSAYQIGLCIKADHDDALRNNRTPIVRFFVPHEYRWDHRR